MFASHSLWDMLKHLFQPADIVLAKVKGYPSWPAMIIPTEIIPDHVIKLHRRSQRTSRNKEEEDCDDDESKYIIYSDMLKFRRFDVIQSSYCLKFFCDDTYTWIKAQDMSLLSVNQCKKWLEGNSRSKKKVASKNKKLIQAYEMAMRGSEGIDIWEFVEYGSLGRPDDQDEYVEDNSAADDYDASETEMNEDGLLKDEDSSSSDDITIRRRSLKKLGAKPVSRPTRSSKRQLEAEEKELQLHKRKTRSSNLYEERLQTKLDKDDEYLGYFDELSARRVTRANGRGFAVTDSAVEKKQPACKKITPAEPTKYKYEDDEDWSLVGMGPQDFTIPSNNSLVNRLAQKKHLEIHNELKLDLQDKLVMVNKLMIDGIVSREVAADYFEILIDELDITLDMRGSYNELLAVLLHNNGLLMNFRALFNIKQNVLKQLNLWNRFMCVFEKVYGYKFIPETQVWSLDTTIASETKSIGNG